MKQAWAFAISLVCVSILPALQLLSIITNDKKAYPFGPRQAPCHKYLYLEDGLGNKREFPMTVRGRGISFGGWGGVGWGVEGRGRRVRRRMRACDFHVGAHVRVYGCA